MKKERMIYIVIALFLMICFTMLAVKQRMSWKEAPSTQAVFDSYSVMEPIEYTQKPVMPEIQDLIDQSSLIVEVEGTDHHELQQYSIRSEVIVLDVYKGDKELSGCSLYIYEPLFVFYSKVYSDGGYLLMQPKQKYILFLNFFLQPDGFRYSIEDKKTYLLSFMQWSKFSEHPNNNTCLYQQGFQFEEIKYYDFLSVSEDELSKYKRLQNDVLKWLEYLESQ